jgi:uncharacterized membrane protein YciS (DUF1049 family)
MKYWILIALFFGIYLGMFTVGALNENQHTYKCHTDQECYDQCLEFEDYPCE